MDTRVDLYCHEVAKRSVARAALHLGVESMSEEALDVLGDVLLTYLQRVGRVMSAMVESSSRSSAHVNVLDALEAVSSCTPPVSQQLHLQQQEGEQGALTEANSRGGGTWQDLAVFLFGKDWQNESSSLEEQEEEEDAAVRLGTGKEGLSSTTAAEPKPVKRKGWEAPYLDEIPPFPQASVKCANPHPLEPSVGRSLHGYPAPDDEEGTMEQQTRVEQELNEIPDRVFTTEWGSVYSNNKLDETVVAKEGKPESDDATEHPEERPKKRVRLDDGSARPVSSEPLSETRPAYVPSFFPPFPSANAVGRIIVDVDKVDTVGGGKAVAAPAARAQAAPASTGKQVAEKDIRSSLVKLGQYSYWGSGWDADPQPSAARLEVKPGRGTTKTSGAAPSAVVVPLARASGSRVGRILEGSMEAGT